MGISLGRSHVITVSFIDSAVSPVIEKRKHTILKIFIIRTKKTKSMTWPDRPLEMRIGKYTVD